MNTESISNELNSRNCPFSLGFLLKSHKEDKSLKKYIFVRWKYIDMEAFF